MAVAGKARSFQAGGKVLAVTVSKPLDEILHAVDADSDNFSAELLLKELGAVAGDGGTSVDGAAVVRRVLAQNGVPLDGVTIADGSGLSSLDRLTPQAIVAILRQCWSDGPLRSTLVQAMAVAGQSGTLEHRLARAGHSRDGGRQDGNDRSRLRALGLRPRPLRVRGDGERHAGPVVDRPRSPGPLRPAPGRRVLALRRHFVPGGEVPGTCLAPVLALAAEELVQIGLGQDRARRRVCAFVSFD